MIDVPTSGIGIRQDWPAPTGYYYEPGHGNTHLTSACRQVNGGVSEENDFLFRVFVPRASQSAPEQRESESALSVVAGV